MKKLLIILLLCSISSFSQNIEKPDFVIKKQITGQTEVDGHISKEVFTFEATLQDVKIYDKDKKEYVLRKCNHEKCAIIHLQLKNTGIIIPAWNINGNTTYFNNTKL